MSNTCGVRTSTQKRLCHLILTMPIIDFCLKYCISTMSATLAIISRHQDCYAYNFSLTAPIKSHSQQNLKDIMLVSMNFSSIPKEGLRDSTYRNIQLVI